MYREETAGLRKITQSPAFRLVPTQHAEEQMVRRDVTRFEVERIVKAGAVVMVDREPDGTETWRVSGHDGDGGRIEVVVEAVPPDMVCVITVIRVG